MMVKTSVDAVTRPESAPLTLPDRLLGFIGGAMIAAAIGLLLFSGIRSDGAGPQPPALRLVSPGDGDIVQAPLTLTFLSEVPLTPGPGGWGTGEYHVHAMIDNVEVMAGPSDVVRGTDGHYRWTIPAAGPGKKSIRLFWSDANHVPVVGEAQAAISVRVVGEGEGTEVDHGSAH